MTDTLIRPIAANDSEAVARIYNHYVRDTVVTFEEEEVAAVEMGRRIDQVQNALLPWLIAEEGGAVIGYAYASKWHSRSAYRYSAEATVYLDPLHTGRGVGRSLYRKLLAVLREKDIHSVVGVIALPNPASIALHEQLGFSKVAHFREIGFKFDRWVDVGYWQVSP